LIEQFQPNPPARPLLAISIPGVIDQYPPHRFGSCRKEMPSTVELLIAQQPQVRFMDQPCGVQRMVRTLLRHSRRCQLSQLVIHQRQQLIRGDWIAGFDSRQDVGNVGHERRVRLINKNFRHTLRILAEGSSTRTSACRFGIIPPSGHIDDTGFRIALSSSEIPK
jgi:hypothetical protein